MNEPGSGDRLARELDAERASTDHWRRVAREQAEKHDELRHRTSVRAVLAAERLLAPWATRLHDAGARAGTSVDRWMLAVRARPRRAAATRRLARTKDAAARLDPSAPLTRSVSIVLCLDGDSVQRVRVPEHVTDVVTLVPRGAEALEPRGGRTMELAGPQLTGLDVRRAIESTNGELVCIVDGRCEPLEDHWLERLASRIIGDVAGAAPVLMHPVRQWRRATPVDSLVRSAGLDIELEEGAPVARGRLAGTAVDLSAEPAIVPAAVSACLLLDRARLDAAGGFPAVADPDAGAVELAIALGRRGTRLVAVSNAAVLDHRLVPSSRALHEPIDPTGEGWRSLLRRHGPALRRLADGSDGKPAHFALVVAAPSRKVAPRWGDWHLASGLADALRRQGHDALVQTRDEADDPSGVACDVRVVLRGISPVPRAPGQVHVLWIISHPESVEDEELEQADLVLVASPQYALHLRTRTTTPVEVLLQATDPHRFHPVSPDPAHHHAVTVVAKTREVLRPVVADALAVGLRPAIYGGGWDGLVPRELVAADHVPNEQLPGVYCSADVVLNDHWRPMQAWGFVSNRLYDVLACGVPVISDPVDGLDSLFDGAVLEYEDPEHLLRLVEGVLSDPAAARERALRGREAVLACHTFDHRARELLGHLAVLRCT